MSLSVCLFPNSSEPQRAEILRDDTTWDNEGFSLKNIRIRRTVSRKKIGRGEGIGEVVGGGEILK